MRSLGLLDRWLALPEAQKINDLDEPSTTELHRRIIWNKPFLRRLYLDFYDEFMKVARGPLSGPFVELGSGGGFLKRVLPSVISSDVLLLSGLDICFTGQQIPFRNHSVDAFFMMNVLHHIKEPLVFFEELNRCLRSNGKIVMIEPANTAWGGFVWRKFHHEGFDGSAEWRVEGTGRLSSANVALPWIIFLRDRKKFEAEFPSLRITGLKCHSPFRYVLSGGVSRKQLLPSFTYDLIKGIEMLLSPWNSSLGMYITIDITKTDE